MQLSSFAHPHTKTTLGCSDPQGLFIAKGYSEADQLNFGNKITTLKILQSQVSWLLTNSQGVDAGHLFCSAKMLFNTDLTLVVGHPDCTI